MKYGLVYDLLYPFSMGGVEKRVWHLARGLAARGHEVHLFGTKEWQGPSAIDRDGVTLIGIGSTRRTHTKSGRRSVWQGVSFALRLLRRLWGERFDVVDVQSMSPLSCLTAVVICRLSATPVVVTWHEVWRSYWHEYLGPVGWLGSAVEKLIAVLADAHIAVSHGTAAKVKGLGVGDVAVIPNGVDIEAITAVDASSHEADIVYVGRLASHKRVDILLDATRILADRGITPRVVLIGDGPASDTLRQRASGQQGVQFLRRVDSDQVVWSIMKSSSVFVSPSTREGFGLATLEALACGTPCIVSDHPENATTELVVHGVNGLRVEPRPDAFANAVASLLANDEAREVMSKNARTTAGAYDLPGVLDLVESFYLGLYDRREPEIGSQPRVRRDKCRENERPV